jgi:uncharacterized protein YndB with AHSA1/START domain
MATPQSSPGLTLQVRRTFAASREKVFAAWTEREQLEKWMCRDVPAHTVIHHQQDISTGGLYRMEIRDPAKGETYWGQGTYREVTPPEKLVFTWAWSKDRPDGPTHASRQPRNAGHRRIFRAGKLYRDSSHAHRAGYRRPARGSQPRLERLLRRVGESLVIACSLDLAADEFAVSRSRRAILRRQLRAGGALVSPIAPHVDFSRRARTIQGMLSNR